MTIEEANALGYELLKFQDLYVWYKNHFISPYYKSSKEALEAATYIIPEFYNKKLLDILDES